MRKYIRVILGLNVYLLIYYKLLKITNFPFKSTLFTFLIPTICQYSVSPQDSDPFVHDPNIFTLKLFDVFVQFCISSSKNCFENFTKFPSKCFFVRAKCFLYFFKIFPRFFHSFFPILLKLFRKNFLKFLHSINKINFELLQCTAWGIALRSAVGCEWK